MLGIKIYRAHVLIYKLIIKLQGVKANQVEYRTPKNPKKEKKFKHFFSKSKAWLSTPTSRSHNVLIVSEKATTSAKQKKQNH